MIFQWTNIATFHKIVTVQPVTHTHQWSLKYNNGITSAAEKTEALPTSSKRYWWHSKTHPKNENSLFNSISIVCLHFQQSEYCRERYPRPHTFAIDRSASSGYVAQSITRNITLLSLSYSRPSFWLAYKASSACPYIVIEETKCCLSTLVAILDNGL